MSTEIPARTRASLCSVWILTLIVVVVPGAHAVAQDLSQQGVDSATPAAAEVSSDDAGIAESAFVPAPRKTIAPWIVDVFGKNYESFTNEGASRVISDWLTNALIDLDLFNIVDRERIRAVLSERNLELSGMARDTSRDVPENELATAGRLLSVNYILLGNVKNLGAKSEIDFKLLDVETTTYSPVFRLNFQIPFNDSIEKFKSVVDRVVAELASSFPIVARVLEVTPQGHLLIGAGSISGLGEGLSAELCIPPETRPVATGTITAVRPSVAEVALEAPYPITSLSRFVVKVAVAPGPEAVLSNGRLEIQRGNFAKARQVLAKGLEDYPEHGRILAQHAHACWRLQDYDGAVGSYREALKAEPNDLELLREAARALFEAGYFQDVVEYLTKSELTSGAIDLELLVGNALAVQGDPLQAREAYKRAFRLDPANPRPHLRLAVLAARTGEINEVERELRLARESKPESVEIELANAVFLGVGARPPDIAPARSWIDRALADGDFAALATASEIAMMEPALASAALEIAEKSVELNPSFVHGRILTAEAEVLVGRPERAVAILEEALTAHPNSVALLLRSGELLSKSEDYGTAELRLIQAQDLAPLQWRAADALGDSYFRQGAHLKAVDAYQKALAIAEKANAPDLVPRLQKLGRSAVLGDQHATAQPYLERCVAHAPDSKACRYYLGLCYLVSNLPGDDERAIVNLRAAGEFSVDTNYYLGVLYDRREDFPTARDWYQSCVDVGCSQALDSQARVDAIESISGTIAGKPRGLKEVSIDRGQIHGVLPSQIAMVFSQRLIVGRVRTTQVQEKTSVAEILGGEPTTGHTVAFRPTRPRGLKVTPSAKRGFHLSWMRSGEPGLASYVVYRQDSRRPGWKARKVLGGSKNAYDDGSVKPGIVYTYRIVAVSEFKQESLPSRTVEIQAE